MNAEVEEFLSELRPTVRQLALELRAFVLAALPEAEERVDFGNRLLVYQLSGTESSQPVYELRPCRAYVELRFWQGDRLVDPERLLAGMGSGLRHVRLDTEEQAESTSVQDLIKRAAQLARSLVPMQSGTASGSLESGGRSNGSVRGPDPGPGPRPS